MPLGDETKKIFLNTKGTNDADVPEELVHFLKYMESSTDETVAGNHDATLQDLHEKVRKLKEWRELEVRYMTFEEMLKRREKKGKAEGKAEGIVELLEELGVIPDEVREKILGEKDLDVLTAWLRLAAKTNSIEDFQSKM